MSKRESRELAPYEAEFNQALDLWHGGDPETAVDQLERLAEQYPNQVAIHGVLGGIYHYELDRAAEALPHCQKAVDLAPRSEPASIDLFHALYALGKHREAWAEMRRFVSIADSEEYNRLLSDMKKELGVH